MGAEFIRNLRAAALAITLVSYCLMIMQPSIVNAAATRPPGTPFYNENDGQCSSEGGTTTISGPGLMELEGHKLPAYKGGTGNEDPIAEDGTLTTTHEAVTFQALAARSSQAHRDFAINMRWKYVDWNWDGNAVLNKNIAEKAWFEERPRLILVTNPDNGKSVIVAALESGPAPYTGVDTSTNNDPKQGWKNPQDGTPPQYKGRVSGLTPKATAALGGPNIQRMSDGKGPDLLYSWAPDQNATPGPVSLTQTASTTSSSSDSSATCCAADSSGISDASTEGRPDFVNMYSGQYSSASRTMAKGKLSKIDTLVIHYTQGQSEGNDLLQFFAGTREGTGIQFNVGKTGTVYQYFPLDDMQMTYHAKSVNGHSIGIEITGNDGEQLINNKAQFASVVKTVRFLCDYYKIPCQDPKGDITNSSGSEAQGMIGHSEAPDNDHHDPDTKIVMSGSTEKAYNLVDGKPWTDRDRKDASRHAYMMKLREALGYPKSPGGQASSSADSSTAASGSCDSQLSQDSLTGKGTKQNPVGSGPNRLLALEAIKYDTKSSNGKYKYVYGGGHGGVAELDAFAESGEGGVDCSGLVRLVIWRAYKIDIGPTVAESLKNNSNFKKIPTSQAAAGDFGVREGSNPHVDLITLNKGGGNLHQFGAHTESTGIYGDDTTSDKYEYYLRYIGPKPAGVADNDSQ